MIAEIYFRVLQRNGSAFIGASIYKQFKATCQERGIKYMPVHRQTPPVREAVSMLNKALSRERPHRTFPNIY